MHRVLRCIEQSREIVRKTGMGLKGVEGVGCVCVS